MLEYTLSTANPCSQYLQIQLSIPIQFPTKIQLQLPAWRAGRYQLANYAQNIRDFSIIQPDGSPVIFSKTSKDSWTFSAEASGIYRVRYEYFAGKMDAGSSWVDEQQVYVNFVNCCLEVKGIANIPYSIRFSNPHFPKVICTLPATKDGYLAKDFQELADSTLLAAQQLTQWTYEIEGTHFNLWFHGEIHFEKEKFLQVFEQFTQKQIRDFGEFPEEEYHFIYQLLPYKHYHGVEHQKGTVITYGPATELQNKENLANLIGVSSHELYHSWNVCRIRPSELYPYDFSKENYSDTGWILEGITTYMGDLYLLKSGFFDLTEYNRELEKTLNRVAQHFGWMHQSILESSRDLWLDGYQEGAPDRKQNIYANGALIAFALDIVLLKHGHSLPQIMKLAWLKFGKQKRGYRHYSFWQLIARNTKNWNADLFFQDYIAGNKSIIDFLKSEIGNLGLNIASKPHESKLTHHLGVILAEDQIKKIHPHSPAYHQLMIGDLVEEVKFSPEKIELRIRRINGTVHKQSYAMSDTTYFPKLTIEIEEENTLRKTWME